MAGTGTQCAMPEPAPATSCIFHICSREVAAAARQSGEYRAPSLATEGFIHLSQAHQVSRVAQAFYTGQTDLVIDLRQVKAVDSAAVSLMLLWLREAQRNKVNLCFTHVPENLLSLARLYDVAELLPLCHTNPP